MAEENDFFIICREIDLQGLCHHWKEQGLSTQLHGSMTHTPRQKLLIAN